ncbi:hypothetical protein NPIL_141911 [Nephila pilipes]|uniref:Uncharacterized protein n=1 Tax=Nephila pilipes TaxID=299642 RepID=A0A8X6JX43_NEPPI|nr:hypothetical protein NPIL_141911 [Nephila pilipes]
MPGWKSKVFPVEIGSWRKEGFFASGWDRLGFDEERDDEVRDRCAARVAVLHVREGRVLGWRKQQHVYWTSPSEKELVVRGKDCLLPRPGMFLERSPFLSSSLQTLESNPSVSGGDQDHVPAVHTPQQAPPHLPHPQEREEIHLRPFLSDPGNHTRV